MPPRLPAPSPARALHAGLDAALDLLAGSTCLGCEQPGRPWCRRCASGAAQALSPWCAWPTPTPPGLAPPWAASAYDGAVRAMVLAHKERGVLSLAGPLGALLATAVRAAVPGSAVPLVLVPVPSRAAGVRARGHDATARLVRAAARDLARPRARDASCAPAPTPYRAPVLVAPLLRLRPGVADQAGLDTSARAANLAGSMAVDTAGLARLARRTSRAHVLVCDDVVTTGATLHEAQRALEASGVAVPAVACVAATTRRAGTVTGLPPTAAGR